MALLKQELHSLAHADKKFFCVNTPMHRPLFFDSIFGRKCASIHCGSVFIQSSVSNLASFKIFSFFVAFSINFLPIRSLDFGTTTATHAPPCLAKGLFGFFQLRQLINNTLANVKFWRGRWTVHCQISQNGNSKRLVYHYHTIFWGSKRNKFFVFTQFAQTLFLNSRCNIKTSNLSNCERNSQISSFPPN